MLLGELVEGQKAVLAVQGPQDAGVLGKLERPGVAAAAGRGELETAVRDQKDAARDRGEGPRVGALEVVRDELVDLLLDDRPLVGVLGGGDPLFQELPVDPPGGGLVLAARRLAARPKESTSKPTSDWRSAPESRAS